MPARFARSSNRGRRTVRNTVQGSQETSSARSARFTFAQNVEYLQRTVGNQAVMRLIAQGAITPSEVSNSLPVRRMMTDSDDEDGNEFYDDSMNTLPRLTNAIAEAIEADDGGHLADDSSGVPDIAHEYRDKPIHAVARRANVNAMAAALARAILAADGGSVTNFNRRQLDRGSKQINLNGGTATAPFYRASSAGTGWVIRYGTATASPLVAVSIQSIQLTIYRTEGMLSPSFTFEITRLHWMPHHT